MQVADGPIKEHLLEEVYEKRQRGRAEADGADIDRLAPPPDAAQAGPSDVKRVSAADADAEELDGEQLSAFNMEREEAEGFDVETLELRRGRGEEEELAKDPWLASLQQEHVRGCSPLWVHSLCRITYNERACSARPSSTRAAWCGERARAEIQIQGG